MDAKEGHARHSSESDFRSKFPSRTVSCAGSPENSLNPHPSTLNPQPSTLTLKNSEDFLAEIMDLHEDDGHLEQFYLLAEWPASRHFSNELNRQSVYSDKSGEPIHSHRFGEKGES